jgi:bifunctional DNA-binding transcriptional regulator/antitoxin component of YhaV-PrlF toxin-antitoxin module
VTIPRSIRERLSLEGGAEFAVFVRDGVIVLKVLKRGAGDEKGRDLAGDEKGRDPRLRRLDRESARLDPEIERALAEEGDPEDFVLPTDAEFWDEIEKRRKQKTVSLTEMKRRVSPDRGKTDRRRKRRDS